MKLKYSFPILFLPVLLACKSKKKLIEENMKLKSQTVQYRQGLDTIKAIQKKDMILLAELKSQFQEMSETISRLEAENTELKYNLQEAEENLKKLKQSIIVGLNAIGIDTIHQKGGFYSENNKAGEFQIIRIKFGIYENPAVKEPIYDTAWISMEDSMHNPIPIFVKSKPGIRRGNMAGIPFVDDGVMHFVKYYIIPDSNVPIKSGFYRFTLYLRGTVRDMYSLHIQ